VLKAEGGDPDSFGSLPLVHNSMICLLDCPTLKCTSRYGSLLALRAQNADPVDEVGNYTPCRLLSSLCLAVTSSTQRSKPFKVKAKLRR
jgi:hypothetical protein